MSAPLVGITVGLCVAAAVWLVAPDRDAISSLAASVLLIVAIFVAARYAS